MAVEPQVKLIVDRVAKGRQLSRANYVEGAGGKFWDLVDASQDELFENWLKGFGLTALDDALDEGTDWGTTVLRNIFEDMRGYFRDGLGITPIANSALGGWLRTYLPGLPIDDRGGQWRVPWDCAEAIIQALGVSEKLPTYCVFPKGTRIDAGDPGAAGMHQFGWCLNTEWIPVDGTLDKTKIVGAGIWVIAADANALEATWRCIRQDGIAYKDITISWGAGNQWVRTLAGAEPLAESVSKGATIIPVASTAAFIVGDYILLYKSDGVQEVVKVKALLTGPIAIELETAIVNGYAATTDEAIPMFLDTSSQAATGSGGALAFAYPDRIIAL
jgi:hypothetical protein